MKRRLLLGVLTAAALAASMPGPPMIAAPRQSCASLASASLPDTTINFSEEIPGPSFATPSGATVATLPPFCRVAATTKPAINFEVWLPLNDWNGKFQGVGNGANAGPTTTLFFTAGPFDEQHGLFGTLVVAPPPGR